jgi:mono/diheme cytochrome c family protein
MSRNEQAARTAVFALLMAVSLLLLAGCAQKMASQGRYKPMEADEFFSDSRSARTMISGTVPIQPYLPNDPFYTGRENGQYVTTVPMTVTASTLLRGRSLLNTYCAPCHGGGLTGNGPVVQKGYPPPPNLLAGDIPSLPVGQLYDVVTHGMGTMPSYAVQIRPEDRWAAVAALRSFQQQSGGSQGGQSQPTPIPTP